MSKQVTPKQVDISGNLVEPGQAKAKKRPRKTRTRKNAEFLPEKLGKAIRLPVPDFSDPGRKPTCLEADFPIAQINALSNLEGNAGKPIYQMSKWWARRRSSVFRSMLIAAATTAPDDANEASKKVWDHYYCNHQKAGSFKKLRVLDPFMGGGTTLVEGSRLGMQMTGVDLNPVAWFVVKNELACSDPEQVQALFDHIEGEVKPQIQPFYTTTCPRGHQGQWLDVDTGEPVDIDPLELPSEARKQYRWHGPEVIYTFWAKHGPCQARGCGHRTPIFRSPVVAEKKLSTYYLETSCPDCGQSFHTELGETRMAPGAELILTEDGPPFTVLSQSFAQLLKDYDKGKADDTIERMWALLEKLPEEPGFCCPACGAFAGQRLERTLKNHKRATRAADRKKKSFGIKRKKVEMTLLIHPDWLKGTSGFDGKQELGGWAGAPAEETAKWFERRQENLVVVEVRGKLPAEVELEDGSFVDTKQGTVPRRAHFTCAACGRENNTLEAVRPTGHTAPVSAYVLQCHCPQCDEEGYNYGGRFFKSVDDLDVKRLNIAEVEWAERSTLDLNDYWPRQKCWDAYMMRANGGVNDGWGYSHWWKMFNPRQLLVHTQLLKTITEAPEDEGPLDVREAVLGAMQQYLRNQNMFCFWDISRDCMAPHMSNANYHPKSLLVENCVFNTFGRGNWKSNVGNTIVGLEWANDPWEGVLLPESEKTKSLREELGDPMIPGNSNVTCGSSTDLAFLGNDLFDLIITDPPFGNNLFYADLADFFYVWLRLPLRKWYAGLPEQRYFEPERTPHSMEAIDNSVEHPDDREEYEKSPFIIARHLKQIRQLVEDDELQEKDPNPFYRPQPSSDFYSQTLSACWAEAASRLKDGGIMAFTFHHNEDRAWIDILKALFDAGYVLVATYPIRSDETKGDSGAFGSRKIEYDIIHVCRKRIEEVEAVSWARMRRWVKSESQRLKELLEHTHGKELPESDLRVILRGTGVSQGELEARGWVRVVGKEVQVIPIPERFAYFTERGRNRKIIKTDLDQTHFLIGAAHTGSGVKIETELNNPNFRIKKSVDELLKWYARMDDTWEIRQYAQTALQLVEHWRTRRDRPGKESKQLSLFELLEQDE